MYSPYELEEDKLLAALSRPQVVVRQSWSSSSTGVLATYDDLAEKLLHFTTAGLPVNNPTARVMSAYRAFKADIECVVWIQGNTNCTGSVIMANRFDVNGYNVNQSNVYCDPNFIRLRAQSPEKQKVLISYKNPYFTYRDTLSKAWGSCVFYVEAPLRNASSATTPPTFIFVQAQFVNITLMGPSVHAYQSEPILKSREVPRKENQSLALLTGEALSAAAEGINAVMEPVKAFTRGKSLLSKLLSSDNALPNNPASIVPNLPIGNNPWNVNGLFTGHVMDTVPIHPKSQLPIENWSSFEKFNSRWSWVATHTVSAASSADQQIARVLVNPFAVTGDSTNGAPLGPTQFTALHFSKWRGPIDYQILFFCPVGTTATFRVSHIPEVVDVPNIRSEDAGDILSCEFPVDKDTVYDITCEYQGITPYKLIPGSPWSAPHRGTCAGSLCVDLVSPLVNSFAVDTTITVVILMRAPKVQFYGPVKRNFIYQGDTVDTFPEVSSSTLKPSRGEDTEDYGPNLGIKSWAQLARIPISVTQSGVAPVFDIFPWEKQAFTAFRAGYRYFISTNNLYYGQYWQGTSQAMNLPTAGALAGGGSFPFICPTFPYSANIPYWKFTTNDPALYGEELSFDFPYLGSQPNLVSRDDGAQYYFPAFLPLIKPPALVEKKPSGVLGLPDPPPKKFLSEDRVNPLPVQPGGPDSPVSVLEESK